MPSPVSRYARGQAKEARLLDAAISEMAERGIEGLTHRAVAARAGLPLSTTSYYLGSMDQLVTRVVDRIADDLLSRAADLAATARSSVGVVPLDVYVDQLVEVLVASPASNVVVQFEAYLASSRRAELRPAARRILAAYRHAVAEVLARLGAPDPEAAARQTVALVDGFALHRVVEDQDQRALMGAALTTLLRAQLPREDTQP